MQRSRPKHAKKHKTTSLGSSGFEDVIGMFLKIFYF